MSALPEPAAASESDAALLERVRNGDRQAYGALWDRHHRAGLSAARAITSTFDAEDLVSEAFVRVLKAIEHGSGPTAAFRPYLVTTVRSVAARWGSQPAELTPEELEIVDPASSDEAFSDRFDQSLTVQAFNTLPKRWQEVLWYTEAEQLPPREAAALIGIKPNAVSALAKRAREGLRHAWVQAHIATVPEDSECRWAIDRLAMSTRKSLPAREQDRLDAHLEECDRCPLAAEEITAASRRLGALILIGFFGAGAATAYGTLLKPAAATAATLGAGAVAGKAGGAGGAGGAAAGKAALVRNVSIGAGGAVAAAAAAVGIAFAAGVLGPQHQPPPVKPAAVAAAPGGSSGSSSSSATSPPDSSGSSSSAPSSPDSSAGAPSSSGTAPTVPRLPASPLVNPSPSSDPVAPSSPAAPTQPTSPPRSTPTTPSGPSTSPGDDQPAPVVISAVDTGGDKYYPIIEGTGQPGATVTATQEPTGSTASVLRSGRMGVLRTSLARPGAFVATAAVEVSHSSSTTVGSDGKFAFPPLTWVQPDAEGVVHLILTQRNPHGRVTTASVTAKMPRQTLALSAPLGSGDVQLLITGANGATVEVRFSDGTEKRAELDASGHGAVDVPLGATSATVGYVDPKSDRIGPTQAVQLASLPVDGSGQGTQAPPVQTASVDAGVDGRFFPIISGTGEPGDTVFAVVGTGLGDFANAVHTQVGGDGSFQLGPLTGLGAGLTTVTLYQQRGDDAGSRSTGVPESFTLQSPSVDIQSAFLDVEAQVTGIPGAQVEVDVESLLSSATYDITLDENGNGSEALGAISVLPTVTVRYTDGLAGGRRGPSASDSGGVIEAVISSPSGLAQIALDLERLLGFAWREV